MFVSRWLLGQVRGCDLRWHLTRWVSIAECSLWSRYFAAPDFHYWPTVAGEESTSVWTRSGLLRMAALWKADGSARHVAAEDELYGSFMKWHPKITPQTAHCRMPA